MQKEDVKLYKNQLKIIFMDTKYNTNSYKLPFFTISILKNEGPAYILSKAFLSDEKFQTFVWALNLFKLMYG